MNLVDLRLILEPGIAELAAYNATDEEIEHLKDLCDTVEYKIEHDLYYIQDDIDFHTYIARCSKNKVVEQIISIIETAVLMFVNLTHRRLRQETIITQRDGRFVVPVKAEHKGDLPGLVHDISSTGATLFVEPMGVVQANNEYIELEPRSKRRSSGFGGALRRGGGHREDIQWDYDALVHLDLIFARGQLSYKMDAVRPEVRRDGAIRLRKVRHPLLDAKTAVPSTSSWGMPLTPW